MNFSPLRSKIRQWLIELRQEVMDNSGNPYNPASNIKGYDPLLTIRKTLSAVTTAQSGQDLLDALNYLEKDYLKRNSKLSKYLLNIRGPQLIAEVNTQLNEYIKSCDKCIGSELVTSAEQKQAIAKEEKSVAKEEKIVELRRILQNFDTTASKQEALGQCQTLQDLCFATSIRQKSGLFHLGNTTTTANELVRLLNLSPNSLLRQEICPDGEKVRMRDIWHYARFAVKSSSQGYFLSAEDRGNERFFLHSKNENQSQPMLMFNRYKIDQSQVAAACLDV
ncbi:hypothetical protein Psal006b_02467 [Piscirickettsia salmonis]|uniref:RasGEF domain protein n=1 Tax=Piscirickettsia salmonis TaxID=1238 RepID=A0AAC8ZNL3_PISSA|nr:hypothetical protein [Piscirickettsia salmonis]ALB21930.1 rasGEF domain protein [Piscirickettsia salmonis]QGN99455.1 hypothetical protein Psal006b_02467 [Piscirickettsia salmonis]QGO03089.1 hypothetical protein Psal008_02485 [Piscirickettsia salmonis]QGO13744.1 hypothetical protein Psal010b_02462 [Piscirickettsia salmonis]QGO20822.1 hypothetical protein Psal013_02492 [Piscirickettsia salmonis]